jgi:hypothetical protein
MSKSKPRWGTTVKTGRAWLKTVYKFRRKRAYDRTSNPDVGHRRGV